MSLHVNSLTVDCRDPSTVARFWTEALGWLALPGSDPERGILIAPYDVSWVVMADPEGNEFCVLRSLPKPDEREASA